MNRAGDRSLSRPILWKWCSRITGWVLILLLVAAGYVQDVGMHFEHVSGLKRLSNLKTYHFLFRGAAWPFFRWGGIIRIACISAVLLLFGWRPAVLSGLGIFALSFAMRGVTKRHAITMFLQIQQAGEGTK